jgi:cytochrome c-type biogenesis protein CcmE
MSIYRDGPVPDLAIAIAIAPDRRRRNNLYAFAGGVSTALVVGFLSGALHAPRSVPAIMTVDQLMATTPPSALTAIRVEGELVPDSVVRQDTPCEYRFAVEKNGFRMPVRHAACVLPDPLAAAIEERYAVPVIVEGALEPEGFVASGVLARVPSCCFCTPEGRKAQLKAFMEMPRKPR